MNNVSGNLLRMYKVIKKICAIWLLAAIKAGWRLDSGCCKISQRPFCMVPFNSGTCQSVDFQIPG